MADCQRRVQLVVVLPPRELGVAEPDSMELPAQYFVKRGSQIFEMLIVQISHNGVSLHGAKNVP
jgi:hypothetical protein